MSYKLKGTIKAIKDTVQVTDTFTKREFVITDDDAMYPQDIMFQLVKDKCAEMDSHKVGDVIDVSFNLRGREWTSPTGEVKFFNTLEAWRIETATDEVEPTHVLSSVPAEDDDLPF